MMNLHDLLDDIQENNADDYERGATGGGPQGDWDKVLPEELEYRAKIVASKYGPSKSSGTPQATITLQIVAPEEYAGVMLQGHYQLPPQNEGATRNVSQLLGALQAPVAGFAKDDYEGYVLSWVGIHLKIAVNHWGDANDRNGVRWVNADNDAPLRTNIKPPKKKANPADIRPEINIPKDEEPQAPVGQDTPNPNPVIIDVAEESAPTPQQTTSLPGGVNLPPGLRG